jgi:hypothetical protein
VRLPPADVVVTVDLTIVSEPLFVTAIVTFVVVAEKSVFSDVTVAEPAPLDCFEIILVRTASFPLPTTYFAVTKKDVF